MYVFLLWWPNRPARRTLFFTDLFVQVENEQVRFGKEEAFYAFKIAISMPVLGRG
jgi:hypothetical protein